MVFFFISISNFDRSEALFAASCISNLLPREKFAYRHSVYPHRRLKSTITTPLVSTASTIRCSNKNRPTPPPLQDPDLLTTSSISSSPCLRPSVSPTERVDPPLRLRPLHLVQHRLTTERQDCRLHRPRPRPPRLLHLHLRLRCRRRHPPE